MSVFGETSLAGLRLRNRIIRSATHEGLGDEQGFAALALAARYRRLAEGGVGAIVTGYAGVCNSGKACPNMLMIDGDECIAGFRTVTTALRPYGVPLIMQLAHGGGRTNPAVTGAAAKAPSLRRYKGAAGVAGELTEGEIETVIRAFVSAIVRARASGFDGVQLHAAHGYLLAEFLSPGLNRRKDRWGGTVYNRFRIVWEIISRAREIVGRYPILIKFSAYDFEPDGMRIEESVILARLFQEATFDAIEVSCGNEEWFTVARTPVIPVKAILAMESSLKEAPWLKKKAASLLIPLLYSSCGEQEDYNVPAAEKIRAGVDIPVIVVGGIRKMSAIDDIISQGRADFVSLCRPFVIEPDIVNKFREGRQSESRCLNCAYCLIGVGAGPLRCYYGQVPNC